MYSEGLTVLTSVMTGKSVLIERCQFEVVWAHPSLQSLYKGLEPERALHFLRAFVSGAISNFLDVCFADLPVAL